MDAALVVIASTAFKLTAMDPTVLTPFQALDTNIFSPMMQLSESDTKLLINFSLYGLKKLASVGGSSTNEFTCFKLMCS